MQRREFMLRTMVSLAVAGMMMAGCRTTVTTPPEAGRERRLREIEAGADAALARLYEVARGSREVVGKSAGVLVFPRVIVAGFVVGGEYGEGVLRIRNKTVDYYRLASISAGLQAGAQSKAIVFAFLTQEALDKFRKSEGWAVGIDASVAVLKVGASGTIDTTQIRDPVVAFVLTNVGLMANLTLEGTKITRLKI